MTVVLIPPADQELEEAISYYNEQLLGLGDQFYGSFLATINYPTNAPDAWRKVFQRYFARR